MGTDITLRDSFSLLVYHRFLLPALVRCSFVQQLSIDAGSVNWRIGKKPMCLWESGGLYLVKRRVSPTAALH